MNNGLKKDLNFFASVGRERGIGAIDFEKSIKRSLMVFVPILIVALAITLGINGIKKAKLAKLNNDIDAMQDQLDEAAEKLAQKEELEADIEIFDEAKSTYDETPTLDLSLLSKISSARPKEASIKAFNYSGLTVSIDCIGSNVGSVASYVHQLRNIKLSEGLDAANAFSDIVYDNTMDKNTGGVSGSITLTLNEVTTEAEEESTETTTAAAE